jgi:hypothetical protein
MVYKKPRTSKKPVDKKPSQRVAIDPAFKESKKRLEEAERKAKTLAAKKAIKDPAWRAVKNRDKNSKKTFNPGEMIVGGGAMSTIIAKQKAAKKKKTTKKKKP